MKITQEIKDQIIKEYFSERNRKTAIKRWKVVSKDERSKHMKNMVLARWGKKEII